MRYLVKKSHFSKKLGRVVTYYYWEPKAEYFLFGKWVKCPLKSQELPEKESEAHIKAESLNEQLDLWRSGVQPEYVSKENSFDWLLCEYKKSIGYNKLGQRTQKEYGYIIEAIRNELKVRNVQNLQATNYTSQVAYAIYEAFNDKPRKAQLVVAISRIVFEYGKKKITGLEKNPFEKLGISKTKPREQIWLDLENDNIFHIIESLKDKAIEMGLPSVALAIDLGLWTTQRQADILKLPWGKYNGRKITLRQGKTKVWIDVPVMPQLKCNLDASGRISPVMLISERTGKPYTKDHFGDVFREVREAAKISDDLQYRDFRRTGVVLLAMSGCTDAEITSISGHTNSEVSDILETYLPRNSHMAANAIAKMEKVFVMQLEKNLQTPNFGVGKIL